MAFDLNENSSINDVSEWLNSNGFAEFSEIFQGMYDYIQTFSNSTWPLANVNIEIFAALPVFIND